MPGSDEELVREIQHQTGLGDGSFGTTASGHLLVEGSGWNGDLTRSEMETLIDIAEDYGYVVWQRNGAGVLKPR